MAVGDRVSEVVAEETRGVAPGEVPGRLCVAAVRLLPVAGAGVALYGAGVPLPLGASGVRAAELMELEGTLGDGPCLEAARTGAAVFATDLSGARDTARWPLYAHQATAAGVGAVYALPLGDGTVCVGTLDLHRDTPGELAAGEVRNAWSVAGVMTAALVALPFGEEGGGPWSSPQAMDHDQIHQAVGMVMAQRGVGPETALDLLRGHAFARGRTVPAVARELLARRLRLDPD
ncbi:GAF and ANTAR domain-containing protein [Streptomyces sp. S9]|nr:GAF and ANTAR domain-containing protein [Streptomyces sp. S9]